MDAEILVGVDVGCYQHDVVIGNADGVVLDHFQIDHQRHGLAEFFDRIDQCQPSTPANVSVAMEGYNGWARPLDQQVLDQKFRLYNVNNLKLARYKEIFPPPAKTDAIDAKRILELFAFQGKTHVARDVLQEVPAPDPVHKELKYLTRRRRQRVELKALQITRLRTDLQAFVPGLCSITTGIDRMWFLRFLTARDNVQKLAKLQHKTVLSLKGIGKVLGRRIFEWQANASFSPDIELAGTDIVNDAHTIITMLEEISDLDGRISALRQQSNDAQLLQTIPGFGDTSVAELVGEIGTIKRFPRESSFSYYIGMAPLDRSSGLTKRSRRSVNINKQCQLALMTCVARHMRCVPESKAFYDRKRTQGKSHNQAVRALGRHLTRVMWSMLTQRREYKINLEKVAKTT